MLGYVAREQIVPTFLFLLAIETDLSHTKFQTYAVSPDPNGDIKLSDLAYS